MSGGEDRRDEEPREHDAEHERRHAEREAEHARDHAEREAEREARRAERQARHEARHRIRAEWRGSFGEELRDRIREEIARGLSGSARKWYFSFGDLGGARAGGAEASEVVEQRFEVSGMPTVRVSNVSGETEVTVGASDEVFVRARKRVHGWSEDRARRLLRNVEIRLEQHGDEIVIEPRLFEQERGWLELFRGGRVAVDLDVRVPRTTHVDARTVSGDLSLTGTRGPIELQSVSGEVSVRDVQGPMRLRTVSGDASASGYAGQVEANSVSGEIEFERSRVRTPDIVTVSGDVDIDALFVPAGEPEARLKTVSGEIRVALGDADLDIDLRTVSGDLEVDGPARVEKQGRRDRHVVVGAGGPRLRVKTVSGDLSVRPSSETPVEAEAGSETAPAPESAPAAETATGSAGAAAAREILERLARGEIAVDDAAAALDAAKRS